MNSEPGSPVRPPVSEFLGSWAARLTDKFDDIIAGIPFGPGRPPIAQNPEPEQPPEDVLVLDESYMVAEEEPLVLDESMAVDEGAPQSRLDALNLRIAEIIAAHRAPGTPQDRGEPLLPDNLDALEALLADPPPATDFDALDLLEACFPKAGGNLVSRAALAVAQNLSRNWGLPGKLPMASNKAWRLLDADVFETELAQRLADVGQFIREWQQTQTIFLILEFGEIALIEYLFEALHPGYHTDLLAEVMNYKVLSNRRVGLVRRIAGRLKKQVEPLLPERRDEALVVLAHGKALLEKIADPMGFAPIVSAAEKALEDLDKFMKQVAAIGQAPAALPPGQGGGLPIGRIG